MHSTSRVKNWQQQLAPMTSRTAFLPEHLELAFLVLPLEVHARDDLVVSLGHVHLARHELLDDRDLLVLRLRHALAQVVATLGVIVQLILQVLAFLAKREENSAFMFFRWCNNKSNHTCTICTCTLQVFYAHVHINGFIRDVLPWYYITYPFKPGAFFEPGVANQIQAIHGLVAHVFQVMVALHQLHPLAVCQ